jgi:hypothetical protein
MFLKQLNIWHGFNIELVFYKNKLIFKIFVSKQHEYYKHLWRYVSLAKYKSDYIDINYFQPFLCNKIN